MSTELVTAIVLFLNALTAALTMWNKLRLEKIAVNVDGKMQQLIDAKQSAAFLGGRMKEIKENKPPEAPPLP